LISRTRWGIAPIVAWRIYWRIAAMAAWYIGWRIATMAAWYIYRRIATIAARYIYWGAATAWEYRYKVRASFVSCIAMISVRQYIINIRKILV
jgi:hypothetical protein